MDAADVPLGVAILIFSLLAFGLSLLLLGAGVLWSPIAAVICYNKAELVGLPSIRYAAVGALYSVLFLMPLIYLSARMEGKRVPKIVVMLAYVVLYVGIWLFGTFSFAQLWLLVTNSHASQTDPSGWLAIVPLVLFLFNILSMIISLVMLSRVSPDITGRRFRETLPPLACITPFALAFRMAVADPLSAFSSGSR